MTKIDTFTTIYGKSLILPLNQYSLTNIYYPVIGSFITVIQSFGLKYMKKEKKIVTKALSDSNSLSILNILFDRLYVLRNQIFHGNATWNSKVNRKQLEQCTDLLSEIIPIFIVIMIENPKVNWGELIVPVLSD